MRLESRKTVYDDLKKYDIMAKENDFIEVTEWTNGEGFDITIYTENNGTEYFQLTYGKLDAINYLTKYLEYNEE